MKALREILFLTACVAALAVWGCAAGGGPLWDPDNRRDNDNDNDWNSDNDRDNDNDWSDNNDNDWDGRGDNDWDDDRDSDWRTRRGDWNDQRDGDWSTRRYQRSTDRRDNYWDDRNSGASGNNDAYWTWGNQSYAVPGAPELTEIRTISQRLDQSADDLMDEFGRNPRWSDTFGQRADGPLATMQTSADAFRAQVAANMTRPDRTVAGYQQVKASHTRLTEAAARRDLNDRAERLVDRIDESVFALDRLYLKARR
jgi:hypothetical protein